MTLSILPALPSSWSDLSWQQLCDVWTAKMRYGGNADVARAAALLTLLDITECLDSEYSEESGEKLYSLRDKDGVMWATTPRELSQMAKQAIPWFDFPYGDTGEPVVKDDKGMVIKEARDPHRGYVGPMRDALCLNEEVIMVGGICFALPQVACNNLTWQQYRSMQATAQQLFQEGITEEETIDLQAQFLGHCLVPAKDEPAGKTNDRFHPKNLFHYDVDRAEQTVSFWRIQMAAIPTLFHICFQCYQTALVYYAAAYPLLFNGSDENDTMRDALQGEVGTVNTVMKYAGYSDQQQVYDSNLPFILDILNTMTKEAKEIEKMNARIKKK